MRFRNSLILSCFLCPSCACLQARKSWEMVKEIVSICFSGKMVAGVGSSVWVRKNVPAKENEVLELLYPLLLVMVDLLLTSLSTCIHTHHTHTITLLHSLSAGILLCGIGTIIVMFQEVGEEVSEKCWFFNVF